jgi:peroxiredoxin
MKPLSPAWIAAGILFAGATVWINYEVKVKLQPDEKSGAVRELGRIRVGEPAPDFSARDLSRQTVSLSDYRGRKVVLVDFWATWCGPCKLAMPGLQSRLDEFRARGLEVLSVDQGETAEAAGDFIRRKAYGFHVLLDPDSSIGARYGVTAIPTLVAVDKQGIVRSIRVGYSPDESSLRQLLEQLVRE